MSKSRVRVRRQSRPRRRSSRNRRSKRQKVKRRSPLRRSRKSKSRNLKCWAGYKRVPGTRAGTKGSCRKI